MRRNAAVTVVALCLSASGIAVAQGNGKVVVTNPTPAVTATAELLGTDSQGCYVTQFSGKVKAAYRGHGANVRLVCQKYTLGAAPVVFPFCEPDDPSCNAAAPNVDACGNFTFSANLCGVGPQLDPSYVCNFLVHVDSSKSPMACQKAPPADVFPADPNGTAPCSGGLCPNSP
jgi:hypothetical protein